jgi:hypothetical protein
MENWVAVKGFNGLYEVSNFGRVKGLKTGKVLKPRITAYGYLEVGLCNSGKRKSKTVHRIVAENFLLKGEGRLVVNHIDGEKRNNHTSNLEWVTQKENVNHAVKLGLHVVGRGSQSPHHKLNEMQVLTIETLVGIKTNAEIARHYKINPTTVCDIKTGKTWSWLTGNKKPIGSTHTLEENKE